MSAQADGRGQMIGGFGRRTLVVGGDIISDEHLVGKPGRVSGEAR